MAMLVVVVLWWGSDYGSGRESGDEADSDGSNYGSRTVWLGTSNCVADNSGGWGGSGEGGVMLLWVVVGD